MGPLASRKLLGLSSVSCAAPTDSQNRRRRAPDPSLLAVKRWLSAYRSGDYVGRALWLNEWYNRVDPAIADGGEVYVATEEPFGLREEMCIGAGAHQHYWDQSAPDIAEKLDELIWR